LYQFKGEYLGFFGGLQGRVNKFFLLWANRKKSKFLSLVEVIIKQIPQGRFFWFSRVINRRVV
jgi:hypothetical protein